MPNLNQVVKEIVDWLDGEPDSDDAFNYLWELYDAYKKENKKVSYCIHFRNYHYDEDDYFYEISKEEYDVLKQHKDSLRKGNCTPTTAPIIEACYEKDQILESQMNWDNCIEYALC